MEAKYKVATYIGIALLCKPMTELFLSLPMLPLLQIMFYMTARLGKMMTNTKMNGLSQMVMTISTTVYQDWNLMFSLTQTT